MSLLDEIRAKAKKKREAVAGDPDKIEFADMIVKLFSNTDYIEESPKSLIWFALFYVGYDVREGKALYQRLLEEVTRTCPVVSPEMLAQISEEKKKADEADREFQPPQSGAD